MKVSDFSMPAKACHNCRRRRWKCDRSLPGCQKCLSSGSECLGYGKLFIWNHGVASRGKMMGKSFQEKDTIAQEKEDQRSEQIILFPAPIPERHTYVDDRQLIPSRSWEYTTNYLSRPVILPNGTAEYEDETNLEIQWPLVDPLVQDLNDSSRYYMFHFVTKLCADMVAYDGPSQNPLRDLVAATSASPLLLQIMIANSALHVFNISRDPVDFTSPHQQEKGIGHPKTVTLYQGSNQVFYRDALTAKQEALALLARSVTVVDETNIDIVLASILLFVNYDLIESGTDKWKLHMEGARKLISLLGNPSCRPQAMSKLRTSMLSDFLVFYILGSTFRFSSSPKLFPDPIDVGPILQYAETNNYLSCPAPLLLIMLESFQLSEFRDTSGELSLEHVAELKALLEKALSFDPVEWLSNFQPTSPSEDLSKRLHIASAHRSAVCIYLARFVPCTNPLLDPSGGSAVVSLTGLADEVVYHIAQLKPGDNLFKSISWPLFLAGAESEDQAQRAWIMDTLDCFYLAIRWGYLKTIKRVLEIIWTFKNEGATIWVTGVMNMGTEMLVA